MGVDYIALAGDLGFERKRCLQAVYSLQSTILGAQGDADSRIDYQQVLGKLDSLISSAERISNLTQTLEVELFNENQVFVDDILKKISTSIDEIALKLNKKVRVSVRMNSEKIGQEHLQVFDSVLQSFLRSVIEFGVESPAERQARGKREYATFEVSSKPFFAGQKIRIIFDGNGLPTPIASRFGRELARHGIRVSFEGKSTRWSSWTFHILQKNGPIALLPIQVAGNSYCIPAWALSSMATKEKVEVSAGFDSAILHYESIGDLFTGYIKTLDAALTANGKYLGVVLLHDANGAEKLSLVLNPEWIVYPENTETRRQIEA